MNQKGFSEGYKNDIILYLKSIEYIEINSNSEMRDIVSKSPSTMVLTVMLVYINFLLESDIMDEDTASYFRKALPSRKTNSDGYVPTNSDIKEAYDKIKKERVGILFQVLAFSGIRMTELAKMLTEFDSEKLITDNGISKYPLNYNRGNKRSQYVYMPSKLAEKLHRFSTFTRTPYHTR